MILLKTRSRSPFEKSGGAPTKSKIAKFLYNIIFSFGLKN
jgi:hypothetical protein